MDRRSQLEPELQAELNIPRPARPDNRIRRNYVRCPRHLAETVRRAEVVIERIHQETSRNTKLRVVQDVEKLSSQLRVEALCDAERLHQGKVPVAIVRATEEISRHIAEAGRAGGRLEKLGDRVSPVQHEAGNVLHFYARFDVPAIAEFERLAKVVVKIERRPRQTTLKNDDGVDLPAFQQLLVTLLAGDIVGGRKSEAVADV